MKDNKDNKLKNVELEDIAGGWPIDPTWIPVDEKCSEYNKHDVCPYEKIDRQYYYCRTCKCEKPE